MTALVVILVVLAAILLLSLLAVALRRRGAGPQSRRLPAGGFEQAPAREPESQGADRTAGGVPAAAEGRTGDSNLRASEILRGGHAPTGRVSWGGLVGASRRRRRSRRRSTPPGFRSLPPGDAKERPIERDADAERIRDPDAERVRNRAVVTVLHPFYHGLTIKEATTLRPSNLDLERGEIHVRNHKGQLRTIGIDEVAPVQDWLDARRRLGIGDNAPLFCTLAGKALREEFVREVLRETRRSMLNSS